MVPQMVNKVMILRLGIALTFPLFWWGCLTVEDTAAARVLFVDKNYQDGFSDGSFGAPFPTIAGALDYGRSFSGSLVVAVFAGEYPETLNLKNWRREIQLTAARPGEPFILTGGKEVVALTPNGTTRETITAADPVAVLRASGNSALEIARATLRQPASDLFGERPALVSRGNAALRLENLTVECATRCLSLAADGNVTIRNLTLKGEEGAGLLAQADGVEGLDWRGGTIQGGSDGLLLENTRDFQLSELNLIHTGAGNGVTWSGGGGGEFSDSQLEMTGSGEALLAIAEHPSARLFGLEFSGQGGGRYGLSLDSAPDAYIFNCQWNGVGGSGIFMGPRASDAVEFSNISVTGGEQGAWLDNGGDALFLESRFESQLAVALYARDSQLTFSNSQIIDAPLGMDFGFSGQDSDLLAETRLDVFGGSRISQISGDGIRLTQNGYTVVVSGVSFSTTGLALSGPAPQAPADIRCSNISLEAGGGAHGDISGAPDSQCQF